MPGLCKARKSPDIGYPYDRWRKTPRRRLPLRYRKACIARHTSLSWNLMLGKNPLWVALQHDPWVRKYFRRTHRRDLFGCLRRSQRQRACQMWWFGEIGWVFKQLS